MKNAFSLVELSIVLVILGLLVGGVLSGQSLIKAAALRSVSAEHQRYYSAIKSFRDKYFAMPGDMSNATQFWGAFDSGDGIGNDCRGEETGLPTCNGNGSGQMEYLNSQQMYELHLFWKHLVNAQLIEGSYTGFHDLPANARCNSGASNSTANCNVPGSKVGNGLWEVEYIGALTGSAYYFNGEYGHILKFRSNPSYVGGFPDGVITAEEAWNIDSKTDDGKPGTGAIVTGRWSTCTTGAASVADGAIATYALSNTTGTCVLLYRNQF